MCDQEKNMIDSKQRFVGLDKSDNEDNLSVANSESDSEPDSKPLEMRDNSASSSLLDGIRPNQ